MSVNAGTDIRASTKAVGVVACGALAADVTRICEARAWPVKVYPLPPLLHNHPEQIAQAVDTALDDIVHAHTFVAVAYADCGTYGALDEVCKRRGVSRLGGQHCYDLYATPDLVRNLFANEPGTYLLTDYLVASFHRSVVVELGLDRFPELRDDYFGEYRRVVWLAGRRTPLLHAAAVRAAEILGLPLQIHDVGLTGLERELEQLIAVIPASARATEVAEGIR